MKARLSTRGLDGLAQRLATRVLLAASQAAAAREAAALAKAITQETGSGADVSGAPTRPVVRISDPALLDRVRGAVGVEGDPVLDRIRLDFLKRNRASGGAP